MKIVIAGYAIRPAQLITIFMVSCLALAAIVGGTNAAPAPRPNNALATNLVSYWKLEETSSTRNDSVGTNHLTSNNSVGYTASGKHGNAATFVSASSQYLSISDNTSISTGDIFYAYSLWFYLTDNTALHTLIAKDTGGTPNREFYVLYDNTVNKICADSFDGTTALSYVCTTNTVTLNSWSHVVVQHNPTANTFTVWLNNTSTSVSTTGNPADTSAPLDIGAHFSSTRYFSGYIDSVGFWKRELSASEITSLYNSGAGCDYPFTACEATATPTATNTSTPVNTPAHVIIVTETPVVTPTFTLTPTLTLTPNWQTHFDLPPSNSLVLEYRATVGDIAVTIVGAFLLLVLSLYAISRMFGPWAR